MRPRSSLICFPALFSNIHLLLKTLTDACKFLVPCFFYFPFTPCSLPCALPVIVPYKEHTCCYHESSKMTLSIFHSHADPAFVSDLFTCLWYRSYLAISKVETLLNAWSRGPSHGKPSRNEFVERFTHQILWIFFFVQRTIDAQHNGPMPDDVLVRLYGSSIWYPSALNFRYS